MLYVFQPIIRQLGVSFEQNSAWRRSSTSFCCIPVSEILSALSFFVCYFLGCDVGHSCALVFLAAQDVQSVGKRCLSHRGLEMCSECSTLVPDLFVGK